MTLLCGIITRHKWKIIDKTILKSPFLESVTMPKSKSVRLKGFVVDMCTSKVIYAIQCQKCKTIKIIEKETL